MITGAHVIIYSQDADADRRFLREVLGFAHVDAGDGWLIFKLPPAEVAVHPADENIHELHLMCDDIEQTVADLAARDVEISELVTHHAWGSRVAVKLPSGASLSLYQPRHPVAYDLP